MSWSVTTIQVSSVFEPDSVCSGSDEDCDVLEFVAELGCGRIQGRAVPTGMIVNEDVAFGSSRA